MMLEKLKLQLLVIALASICLATCSIFLIGCYFYSRATDKINYYEEIGNEIRWDIEAQMYVSNWTTENQALYNEAINEKEALIESSDIARWCQMSAYTKTGLLVRVLTILVAIAIWVISIIVIVAIIKDDLRYLYRKFKRRFC